MTPIYFNNKCLLPGLYWGFHDSRGSHRTESRRLRPAATVLRDTDEGILAGWYQGDDLPKGETLYSAALLVGAVQAESLIYHKIADGKVWVCAIRDALPLPGTDQVVTEAEAETQLVQYANYQTHGVIIGNHVAARQTLEQTLYLLTDKDWAQARMRRSNTLLKSVGLPVATTATAALMLFVLLRPDPIQEVINNPSPSLITTLPIPIINDGPSEEMIAAAQQAAIDEWKSLRPEVTALSTQWLSVLRDLPLSHQGYRPVRVLCQLDNCTIEWLPGTGRFSVAALKSLPGNHVEIKNHMTVRDRVQTIVDLDVTPRQSDLFITDNTNQYSLNLMERLSTTNLQYSISEQRQPARISYDVEGQSYEHILGRIQSIQIMADSLLAAEAAFKRLEDVAIWPERATFTILRGSVSIQMEARYVVDAS